MPQDFTQVTKVSDVPPGTMIEVDLEGASVLVANVDGEFFAVSNLCTHAGGSLCDGYMDEHYVECPLHGAVFDLKTGKPEGPPADEDLDAYTVRVDGEDVLIARS